MRRCRPEWSKSPWNRRRITFDKLYSYIVPDSLGEVKRGCRVLVPFGGGNRKRQGVVVELGGEAEVAKLKPVFSVLDASPLLDDEMMDLALWIKERTFCTIFDVVRAMLPTGFSMRVRPVYRRRRMQRSRRRNCRWRRD